jgi:MFS superfamily sulfate permease-like transporter
MLVALLVNILRTDFALGQLFAPTMEVKEDGDKTHVHFKGPLGFGNFIAVRGKLDQIAAGRNVVLNFSQCRYVDHTVVERISDFIAEYERGGGSVEKISHLRGTTKHPMSAWVK